MTVRNLDHCFRPRSVAVVGASERQGSVGSVVLRNILAGGFEGPVYPINLKYDQVQGLRCYRRPADLPEAPDLAVIMTPPQTVPGVIGDLGARGCKSAVVITAGIDKADGLRAAMLEAARPHMMRIVGPNTVGLLSPHVSLNASFAHLSAKVGSLGLISQSGAIVTTIVDWAAAEDIGFSQLLSLGDMADVDVGDCLNWLAADLHTKAILIYLESVQAPRKFMSAARAAARLKPVIAVKPGRHGEAAKAALTHTGALAGADNVVDAALRRAGVIRVDDLEDLFHAAEITARFSPLRSGRLAIVTNGGGAGVLAVDGLLDRGGTLAQLAPETLARLDAVMPATWSRANPVDIIGDAPPERYTAAVQAVAADPGVDALLAMNCPTAMASSSDAAAAVAALGDDGLVNGKPLIACWLGKQMAEPARAILRQAGIATADTPSAAADAVSLLTRWWKLQKWLERIPASTGPMVVDREAARRIILEVAGDGRRILTEPEAKAVLTAYGIACPEILVATDEAEVAWAAEQLLKSHPAIVVKLLSKTLTHKSDLGGVVLNLTSPEAARKAAAEIRGRVDAVAAGALDGYTVQPMIRRPGAHEILVGLSDDPGFGPVILFGAGGTAVEVLADTATGLVPLDDVLAGDMIDATRISRLLAGYRDHPTSDRASIVRAMLSLSQLAIDCPAVIAVDINPLLVDAEGAIALDARIEIDLALVQQAAPNPRLAIRPYPSGWDATVKLGEWTFALRPIRPADADLYPDFLARVTPEDMRLRFLTVMPRISHETLVRFSQLDYDRDIAFVALEDGQSLAGIARFSAEPDHETAEFGVLVRSDLQGLGLGNALMHQLIAYARADGIRRLTGLVLRENGAMLQLADQLGFERQRNRDAGASVEIVLQLD